MAAGDLLHRAAKEDHRVGRGHAGHRGQRELELARAELDLVRAKRKPQLFEVVPENFGDRIDEIVALLGQVLIARSQQGDFRRIAGLPGVRRLQARIDDPEDVELDLQAHNELEVLELP